MLVSIGADAQIPALILVSVCVRGEGRIAAALDRLFSALLSQITSQGTFRVFSGLYQSSHRLSIVCLVTAEVELEGGCHPQGISQGPSFIYSVFSYHSLWSRSPFHNFLTHTRVCWLSLPPKGTQHRVGGTRFFTLPNLWTLPPSQWDMPGTRVINWVFSVLQRNSPSMPEATSSSWMEITHFSLSFSPLTVSIDTIIAG